MTGGNLGGDGGKLCLLSLDLWRLNKRKTKRRKKETMNNGCKKSGSTSVISILDNPR